MPTKWNMAIKELLTNKDELELLQNKKFKTKEFTIEFMFKQSVVTRTDSFYKNCD